MKFDPQEWLSRYGGDAIKALESLHKEVEDREKENGGFRDDVRNANRERDEAVQALNDFKSKAPKSEDLLDEATKQELNEYRALGKSADVKSELETLRESNKTKDEQLFDISMKATLKEAKIDEQYLPQALTVLKANKSYFVKDENDANAEEKFDVEKFKTDNAVFFLPDDGVTVLGSSTKGAGDKGNFSNLANNYVKNRYDAPAS